MRDLYGYEGKRVVVVGGASGQGAATARLVRELGAEVVVCDVREPAADVGTYVPVDLSDPASIEAAVSRIGAPVDALFNCAGLSMTHPPLDVFRVNFIGLRHFTETCLPLISPEGAIASISSIGGMGWMGNQVELTEVLEIRDFAEADAWAKEHADLVADGYTLSKEAIILYTMARAAGLARQRIRINCISPGAVDTPMLPEFVEAAGKEATDVVASVAGRPSTPEEQAQVLLFLNSEAASYVHGANIYVDGGFTAAIFTGSLEFPELPGD